MINYVKVSRKNSYFMQNKKNNKNFVHWNFKFMWTTTETYLLAHVADPICWDYDLATLLY